MGTKQAFNAGGNMCAALALGAIGYFLGLKWMFYLAGALCVAAIVCVLFIRASDIDYSLGVIVTVFLSNDATAVVMTPARARGN